MGGEVRAVIDVGTNSVKLLVATVDGAAVRPIEEGSEQTRLGQGFYETHVLQAEPIQQTARAVAVFAERAKQWKPARTHVLATSAARDAMNREELIAAIEREAGLKVDVISGEQEADWAFEGVCSDPALASEALLVIDIGGGSTEFTAGRKGERVFGQSFKLGTVRHLERNAMSDPPSEEDLRRCVEETGQVLKGSSRRAGPARSWREFIGGCGVSIAS
jgi:exopolyphosphatase / guanosine-5'-triphosphate,3'-diphosphate pyrophosphatase